MQDDDREDASGDRRALTLIALGWAAVLAALPPGHEYAVLDDWIYAGSVRRLLATGRFVMPDQAQAILIGQTAWGSLWSVLFGFDFATLTWSTLVMALLALFSFYGLSRALGVRPVGALLGTALLGMNPIFLHLSYSFMTDVPCLALVLASCFCYVRGVQTHRLGFFAIGGMAAGWGFLIRQFAILVPAAFAVLLVIESLYRRRLLWRETLVALAGPLLALGFWVVWIRGPLTPTAAAAASRSALFLFKGAWPRVFLLRSFTILPLTALSAWTAMKIPRRHWPLIGVTAVLLTIAIYAVDLPSRMWIAMFEPPFALRLGPLSVRLPQQSFSFGGIGNLIRVTGIDFFEYRQEPVWAAGVWRSIWLAGVGLAVLLLTKIVLAFREWCRPLRSPRPVGPLFAVYLLGFTTFVVSMAFPGDLFDRYMLAFLPFVLLFAVRGSSAWGRASWAYSAMALILIAFFSLLAQADFMDHAAARWKTATWLSSRVGPVHMAFDWDHWAGGGSDAYQVADIPIEGFRTARRVAYTCRLCGFTTRYVYGQVRADRPLPSGARSETPG